MKDLQIKFETRVKTGFPGQFLMVAITDGKFQKAAFIYLNPIDMASPQTQKIIRLLQEGARQMNNDVKNNERKELPNGF